MMLLFTAVSPAAAASFTVDDAGDASDDDTGDGLCETAGSVCTLRAAIEQANALGGSHTVTVGVAGPIVINGEMAVTSAITLNGGGVTVDGDFNGRIFNVTGSLSLFSITLTHGGVSSTSPSGDGGAVYVNGGSLTVGAGALLLFNYAGYGAGAYVTNGGLVTVAGGALEDNDSFEVGAGIFAFGSGTVVRITSGTLFRNIGGRGGGIFASGGAFVDMQGGTLTTNDAGFQQGGAVYLEDGATMTMSGGTITANTTTIGGGGIYAKDSGTVFTQTGGTITGNNGDTIGGGIMAQFSALIQLNGGSITSNTLVGAAWGAGVHLSFGADLTINGGSISGHTAGALFRGGGVYATDAGTTVTLDSGSITGNSVSELGGGLYLTSGASFTMNGGSLDTNNAGSTGGAIFATDSSSVTISGGTVNDNTAGFAAGIYLGRALITYNSASDGSAFYQDGGATTVGSSAIVCNNDAAVRYVGGSNMAMGNNWWGSTYGPYYATSTEGLQCSTGDSLNTAAGLDNYGITVTTPSPDCLATPLGNWQTSSPVPGAPALTEPSSISPRASARVRKSRNTLDASTMLASKLMNSPKMSAR
ncbi:MAG: hypothetical protein IPK19_00305 [Chloroflexi bacterium]|nr:hypothetical protein [Chloroflexota bacterium]